MRVDEKLKTVYETIAPIIVQNERAWKEYLDFAVKFYKYSFDNTLLVYAQNRNVSMLATTAIWNKVGRYVSKGEKGIGVCEYTKAKLSIKYLFDVSQTHGQQTPNMKWSVEEVEKDKVVERLAYSHNIETSSYGDCITKIIESIIEVNFDNYLQEFENDIKGHMFEDLPIDGLQRQMQDIIIDSVKYFVAERCNLTTDELNIGQGMMTISHFDTIPLIARLGYTVTDISKGILMEVERTASILKNLKNKAVQTTKIISMERSSEHGRNQFELHRESGRAVVPESTDIKWDGRRQSATREVRANGDEVSPRKPSREVYTFENGWNTDGENAQGQQGSGGQDRADNTTDVDKTSDSRDRRYISESETSEQFEARSGGSSSGRDHLQSEIEKTENQVIAIELPESEEKLRSGGSSGFKYNVEEVEEKPKVSVEENVQLRFTNINPIQKDNSKIELNKLTENEISVEGTFKSSKPKEKAISVQGTYETSDPTEKVISDDPTEVEPLQYQVVNNDPVIEIVATIQDEEKKEIPVTMTSKTVSKPGVENFRYNEELNLYQGGAKTKYKNNMEAIKLLKQIESKKRKATLEEQIVLANYVGWGGLANAFNGSANGWEKEYQELKHLLDDKEYKEAMQSTITAYYTEPKLIRLIYKALEQFGFEGGPDRKILDPAMGTGNFFSVLPESIKDSKIYGVELDSITGRIARLLYPKAEIQVQGYETTNFPDNHFDIAIGNIPFNNIKLYDRRYAEEDFLIHDYFIAKTLDLVKPGGMIAFITTKGTMDKTDTSVREYIAERADLVGAIRLPNTAFKALAGTEVTADIIFLKKADRIRKLDKSIKPNWVFTEVDRKEYIRMNQYFIDHKDMLLGEMKFSRNMYGSETQTACIAPEGQDLYTEVETAMNKLHGNFSAEADKAEKKSAEKEEFSFEDLMVAEPGMKNYTFVIKEDSIYYIEKMRLIPLDIKGKKAERIKGLCAIRDELLKVIGIQTNEYQEEELKEAQEKLNVVYDEFVSEYGYINDKPNLQAFAEDDQFPLLRSIENQSKDKSIYNKTPIFYKATIRSHYRPNHAENAKEALEISLNLKMRIDIPYMAELTGKSPDEVIEELGDRIYLNPQKYYGNYYEGWEVNEEYLSGEVKDKLIYAKMKAEEYPELLSRNVDALEAVQPIPLLPADIDFRIGSPWIPVEYYEKFLHDTLQTPFYLQRSITVEYIEYTTTWRVNNKNGDPTSVKVNQTFGTTRVNAYQIFEDSLNLQSTTVRDPVSYIDDNGTERIKYVINPKETMIARSKQSQLKEAFKSWLFRDKDRAEIILKIYNDKFNTIRPREYNGSHLIFPNMNETMELRAHQKNFAARVIYSGRGLAGHVVGAGKTAALIASGMYLKQIGAIRKPIYVVPNHLTDQWANEFLRFFPSANVLITSKEDFNKQNRNRFVSKIAMGDYDAVIIGHSQFEKIPISRERQEKMLNDEINQLEYAIRSVKEKNGDNWTIKQMVIFQKNLKMQLDKLVNESKKDNLLTFEQLGVDYMFLDEAHYYKNCFTYTKMRNVAGVGKSSSQRAMDMLLKCQYLQEINNGKGVVFATGTPISNSMSEMFVMMRYLEPEQLERLGLSYFDSWAATFGEVVSSLEITPEGTGYRMKNRFAKFHNLPELMNVFRMVADIQTQDMLDLKVPDIKGGKPEIVVTECTPHQRKIMDEFVIRAEAIRNNAVDATVDNMLKLTNEAKLMSIDPRLIDEEAPNEPTSKLNLAVGKIYEVWDRTKEGKLTQLVFCDSGTPKAGKFNVYDEMKERLIEKGISADDIAFVHDAKTDKQREDLFEKVREGTVRILLGSTSKLGTGTNVQDKLIAVHHLDCPWRPSDIEQRDGRILRQGNQNEEVELYRYVTKGSFDSYLWQIQEQKLKYITQVMTGKSISRSCEDSDETVLSAAEVKAIATSNPLLSEKMEVDNEVVRLKILKANWTNERLVMERNVSEHYPRAIANSKKVIHSIKEDIVLRNKTEGKDFTIEIDGTYFDDKPKAGEFLMACIKLKDIPRGIDMVDIGEYRGFQLYIARDSFNNCIIHMKGIHMYSLNMSDSGLGSIVKLENLLAKLDTVLVEQERKLENTEIQLIETKNELLKPFEYEEQLMTNTSKQAEIDMKLEFNELNKGQDVILDDMEKESSEKFESDEELGEEAVG